jgi:two-component system response regulator MprA
VGQEDSAHILVVDDDPTITRMLRRTLTYEGYRVSIATDGETALRLAHQLQPSAVVLDVMLPDISGLEVCRRLRAHPGPPLPPPRASSSAAPRRGDRPGGPPVLLLTARDEVRDRVLGLDSGADDYLVKPFATEELLARLRVMLRRNVAVEEKQGVLAYADLSLDTATREARRNGRLIELRTTEYELLALFLRHPKVVLTRDQLMEEVWGYDFEGESNVLEVYVRYLRTKLEADGAARLIHTVRGAGYVLREQ